MLSSKRFLPVLFVLLAAAAVPVDGDEWPFELLVDLETTGEPLPIPPNLPAPPIPLPGSNPSQFLVTGDRMAFVADDRLHGAELWTTDGTPGGTERVFDLCPGPCSSSPVLLGLLDGRLIFWANDGQHGLEPWVTDGTAAGTRLLADVCVGVCDGRYDYAFGWIRSVAPEESAVAGGRMFFVARELQTGHELWTTDGTPGGTRRVADICEGSCDSIEYFNGPLAAIGDRVLFFADDGELGEQLWASDGQTAWLVDQFCHGPDGVTGLRRLAALEDRVVFGTSCGFRDGKLWASDGTPNAVELLAELPDSELDWAPWINDLIPLERNRLLIHLRFFASSLPNQLWTTDGTAAGTGPVFDQLPDAYRPMVRYGKQAAMLEGSSSGPIWITDGKPGGTRRIEGVTATAGIGTAGSWLLFHGIDQLGREGLFAIEDDGDARLVSSLQAGSGLRGAVLDTGLLPELLLIPAYADEEEGAELWIAPWRRPELGRDLGTRPFGKLR